MDMFDNREVELEDFVMPDDFQPFLDTTALCD